ncbi:MAG: flagellar protein FliT [Dehalococcoidia bacterium]
MTHPLLEQQFAVLREIFEVSRVQRACIQDDETGRLTALMDERDVLVRRLQDIAGDASDLPANVVAFRAAPDEAGEDTLALDTMIRAIVEHDRVNQELLAARMAEVRAELPSLRRGRRAQAGYRPVDVTASFTDRIS